MTIILRRVCSLGLGLVLLTGSASAQSPARRFDRVSGVLKTGQIVIVADKAGNETWGMVSELFESSLVLFDVSETTSSGLGFSSSSRRTFAADEIVEILRSDGSRSRGARIYLPVPSSFSALQRALRPGETVLVTDTAGQRVTGKVAAVSPSGLVLGVGSTPGSVGSDARLLAPETVTRVVRRDSLLNGVVIGAAIAVFPALATAMYCVNGYGQLCTAAGMIVAGGVGGGALIDRAINRDVVYSALRGTGVRLSPFFQRERGGVLLALGF